MFRSLLKMRSCWGGPLKLSDLTAIGSPPTADSLYTLKVPILALKYSP